MKTLPTAIEKTAAVDEITFRGHPQVSALHPTTIEITTERHLTRKGDCIVGVGAERGCSGFDSLVKERIRNPGSVVSFRFIVGAESFRIRASGDPRLTLAHPNDIVIRKSDFISDRTAAVRADGAAKDFPRRIVALLRDPDTVGHLEVGVT